MSADDHEIIQPPSQIKDKVSIAPDGVDLDVLEKAEAVVAGLQDSYIEWVQEDIVRAQKEYDRAVASKGERGAAMREIFRIAHDVKGQGGSFNYHLMTTVGNLLCRFVEGREDSIDAGDLKVVRLHIDAMRLIIGQRMEGDGGADGKNLLDGLAKVAAKRQEG